MLRALSKTSGIGGTIKSAPDDFVVEEITKNGIALELNKQYTASELGFESAEEGARFTMFVMQKRDWNTAQALRALAKRHNHGIKSMGFAGTKDKAAVTTQLCSVFKVKPEQLMMGHVKDITINGAWPSNDPVKMGELMGNRFTIKVVGAHNIENADKINGELNGIFPNYFGGQRFGNRDNNITIGVNIMKGDFKEAAMQFLTNTTNETNEDAVAARKKLEIEQDFRAALGYFPEYLRYERLLLEHLARVPTDFAGAIRRLPRTIALMFVHSVESYIFNKELEARVGDGLLTPVDGDLRCATNSFGFPDFDTVKEGKGNMAVSMLVGYDKPANDAQKKILDELGVTQDMFKVKSMPELNCKGTYRVMFAPYIGFEHKEDGDNTIFKFSLPSGSYATVLMNEFMKG